MGEHTARGKEWNKWPIRVPGGLPGMIVFRHKTAKWTFKFKYALALIPFAAEIAMIAARRA